MAVTLQQRQHRVVQVFKDQIVHGIVGLALVLQKDHFIELADTAEHRVLVHIQGVIIPDVSALIRFIAGSIVKGHVHRIQPAIQPDRVPAVALLGHAEYLVDLHARQRSQQVEGIGIALTVGLAV